MAIAAQYYICDKCHFRTPLLSELEDHILIHPSPFSCFNPLKPLKCFNCDFTTESLLLLKYHLAHNHDQQQYTLKATLKTCKKCDFHTHSNYIWNRHHTFGTCKDKKVPKEKRKKYGVSMKKDGQWYLCKKCDFRTLYPKNLTTHVIHKHTPLEEIEWQRCKECLATFKTLNALKQHQKIHIPKVDRLHCTQCYYTTPLRNRLQRHINSKHAHIKWMKCHKCGTKFKNANQLNSHLVRRRSEDKPYKCDYCCFKSRSKKSVKMHIVRCHDDSTFKCDLCNYRAKSEKTIQTHKENNHGVWLKCEHCDFSTNYKRNMKNHVSAKHNIDT